MNSFIITHLNMQDKNICYKTYQPTNMFSVIVWKHTNSFKMQKGAIQITGIRKMQPDARKIAKRLNATLRELKKFAPCQLIENEYEL